MIVIDPAHGGHHPSGRSTPFGRLGARGAPEKDLVLAVSRRVGDRLGPAARLTRADDRNLSLGERARTATEVRADAFVSVHASPDAREHEVWVHAEGGPASARLADAIRRRLEAIGSAAPVRAGDLAVLHPGWLPSGAAACLVELAGLDDGDGPGLDRVADAIAGGVRESVLGAPSALYAHYPDLTRAFGREGELTLQQANAIPVQYSPGSATLVTIGPSTPTTSLHGPWAGQASMYKRYGLLPAVLFAGSGWSVVPGITADGQLLAMKMGVGVWFRISNVGTTGGPFEVVASTGEHGETSIGIPGGRAEFVFHVRDAMRQPHPWWFAMRATTADLRLLIEVRSTWIPGDPDPQLFA